jgi:O-acetyl-ADP-ribose deacetylase (regulator of RNase III)
MTFEHKIGDIFTTTLPAIGHGVNLHAVMGSGIAKLIKQRFPAVFAPYAEACKNGELTVGSTQVVQVVTEPEPFFIMNLASQDAPGRNARYEWLEGSLEMAVMAAHDMGLRGFALPRIGAGIGGLEWDKARDIIERIAEKEQDLHIEIWSLPDAD